MVELGLGLGLGLGNDNGNGLFVADAKEDIVKDFLARHASKIVGVLSGFDRIVFRGYLRSISYAKGFETFLVCQGVLLKDFSRYVRDTSQRLKATSLAHAEEQQRPTTYINSSSVSKEDEARRILRKHPVDEGLICVLSCVEPCSTYEIHRSTARKRLELRRSVRKCLHLYHLLKRTLNRRTSAPS